MTLREVPTCRARRLWGIRVVFDPVEVFPLFPNKEHFASVPQADCSLARHNPDQSEFGVEWQMSNNRLVGVQIGG